MKALRTFALAVAVLTVTPGIGEARSPERGDPSDRMIAKMNDVRAKHGVPALRTAPALVRSANGFARHLIRSDSFGHGSNHASKGFRRSGEILAIHRGWSRKPSPPLRRWLRSPGHSGLILADSFRYVGVAPARGYVDGARTTIWVAHFGAR